MNKILFLFSGSEVITPTKKQIPGPFLHEPSEGTIEHYALALLRKRSKLAHSVGKKLFDKNQTEIIGERLYHYLNVTKSQIQIPRMVALAMILDIELSETDWTKLKHCLDEFVGPILPSIDVIRDLKDELLAPIMKDVKFNAKELTCPMKTLVINHLDEWFKTEKVAKLLSEFSDSLEANGTITVVSSTGKLCAVAILMYY